MDAGGGVEVVGIVPAAGMAERLGHLPCSKEVFPLGFRTVQTPGGMRQVPRVACDGLLEQFVRAGAMRAFVVLRSGKWDIPAYLGDGGSAGLNIAYLMIGESHGVPYTLCQAIPFLGDACVLIGFPDTMYEPADASAQLVDKLDEPGIAAVLGLFPADRPDKMDMVELDPDGNVSDIIIKPRRTDLRYAWSLAAWKPAFTVFLNDFVAAAPVPFVTEETPHGREMYLGDVVRAAVKSGFRVATVRFEDGWCLDIGTAEDLQRLLLTGGQSSADPAPERQT